jgi:DNA-directed RNA polymerase specialized sigma24 family protein
VSDVTQILDRAQQGDPQAADELLPLVYDELRRLAQSRMAQDASGQTLQATALVHEAWLRLGAGATQRWEVWVTKISSPHDWTAPRNRDANWCDKANQPPSVAGGRK